MLRKKRQVRLADAIRDIIANCITQTLNDPRVREVVITQVRLSGDLQLATVYFRIFDEKTSKEEAKKGLEGCRGLFRRMVGDAVDLRRVPELRFFYDESIEKGARIEHLIATINSKE
ncbi:MAG: 30S ribosome-binding factor RbfA [Deltaproteobacteria bacterium]|nr:30S ribosome-binding factor RbfA [Deltaproteobacteria bacterium]